MKIWTRYAAIGAASFALAACGGSDDASSDLEPETVEMPADEALEPVSEQPVADPAAQVEPEGPPPVSQETAQRAADRAATVAAEAAAAAEAAEAAAAIPVE